jgi:hypothetical protein
MENRGRRNTSVRTTEPGGTPALLLRFVCHERQKEHPMLKSVSAALALAFAVSFAPAPADATPKHCPPGHAKKGWCDPGQRYYAPAGYRRVDDWRRHDLPAPRPGYSYGVIDEEVFLILDATREVLEAVGAVSVVLAK